MRVIIGNPCPIELRLESGTPNVRYLPYEAETRFVYPDGMSLHDAVLATVDALSSHMGRGHVPAWIESDSTELQRLLCGHYGINKIERRPGDWGSKGSPMTPVKKEGESD